MLSYNEAQNILDKLDELPVEVEQSIWAQVGRHGDEYWRSVEFNGEQIATYDFKTHGDARIFFYRIGDEAENEVNLNSWRAKDVLLDFVKRIREIVFANSADIKLALNELREIIPEKYRSDDTAKFLRGLREYIVCL